MYARLDDGFHDHPTVLKMGNEAAGLYARAVSYAAHYETDGRIPKDWLDYACGRSKKPIQKLVDAGKITDRGDHWELVSFLEYNRTREKAEEIRQQIKERKRKWREQQNQQGEGTQDGTRSGTQDGTDTGERVPSRTRETQPRPAQPRGTFPKGKVPWGLGGGPASDAAPADAAALSAGWTVATSDVLDRCWRCDEQFRMSELESSGLCSMCAAEKDEAA